MKDEKDLYMKFVVLKIDDINKYMLPSEKKQFWKLFWRMVEKKEIAENGN